MFGIRKNAACACLIAAMLTVSMTDALALTNAQAAVIRGDCDGNGIVEIADVHLLTDYLAAQTSEISAAADLDGNAAIDAVDLTLLKRMILTPAQEESMTVMVYLCASDLESQAQQATMDMDEMLSADTSENLNVVIAAGGTTSWSEDNPYVEAGSNYTITHNAQGVTVETHPQQSMATAAALSDFIADTAAAYPADRYALILWDHGGGPMYGLCYDEVYEQMISIPSLCTALDTAQVHFEWIGFDCCLMGNAEIAYAIRDYADYMIASEEAESGLGWDYTGFLNQLADNPMTDTTALAQTIIDDMISANRSYRMEATLALYDLSCADAMMYAVYDYIDELYALYEENGIQIITTARKNAQDFGDEEYDLVDLGHLAALLPTDSSTAMLETMDTMILYSKTYRMNNANGLSLWFFEHYPQEAKYLDYTMARFGIDADYIDKLQAMATAAQTASTAAIESTDTARERNVLIQAFRKWLADLQNAA